jgi:hypothetical protein
LARCCPVPKKTPVPMERPSHQTRWLEVRYYISPETECGVGETELQGLTSPRAKPGSRIRERGHSFGHSCLAYPIVRLRSAISNEVTPQCRHGRTCSVCDENRISLSTRKKFRGWIFNIFIHNIQRHFRNGNKVGPLGPCFQKQMGRSCIMKTVVGPPCGHARK